jgi:NADPH:quinone reductase-like Zn-dependent oxidoreductase
MKTYKHVVLTKRGGPETLQVSESELHTPQGKDVRIRILACGVGRTDVAMRYGYYPFAPKIPFVPGYEIVGIVDAIGSDVTTFTKGDKVAALTVHGGYSEYIYLEEQHLVQVPDGVDEGEAVALILNYTTAYQMLKREANVQAGDKVLITGASGGVGAALLELGQLEQLRMYATASKVKHDLLLQYGAYPIDYRNEDFVKVVQQEEPTGLNFVFDGIGGAHIKKSFRLLKKGGKLVEYGFPGFRGMLWGLLQVNLLNMLPNQRHASFYGISGSYKSKRNEILADIEQLFILLKEEKIKPRIYKRLPLLEASNANRILESGAVKGKIVLLAS